MCNLPWISEDVLFSKDCKLSSGIDLQWGSQLVSSDLFPWFLDSAKARHLENPKIKHAIVRAFVLEPGNLVGMNENDSSLPTTSTKTLGNLAISGESIPIEKICVELHEGLMNVFVPYWLDEDKNISA